MKSKTFIGIDISKKVIDLCLLESEENDFIHCNNEIKVITKNLKQLIKKKDLDIEETVICAEYTGMYIYPLIKVCQSLGINLWLESGATIKWSSGIQRGKNDKVDSERIALYASRFIDKAKFYACHDEQLDELSYLNSERELLTRDRAKYKSQIKDQKGYMPGSVYKSKKGRLSSLVRQLSKSIKEIEDKMCQLIEGNEQLQGQYEIITSIGGIGQQIAMQTIIATRGFTKFTDARKFCCHVGVAPFAYTSGSSQTSRWKVSQRANKKLKSLFHLAAISTIRMNGEMTQYYERKVAEGKNKMSVINAMRSKLIHRVFALIRDGRLYEEKYLNTLV
jgi:transposase